MKLRYPILLLAAIPLLYLAHQKVEERLWIAANNDHCEPYRRGAVCLIVKVVEER